MTIGARSFHFFFRPDKAFKAPRYLVPENHMILFEHFIASGREEAVRLIAGRLSALNVRLRYIFRPNSDFFVIYNQTTGKGLERPSYSLQMKVTYDFNF